MHSEAARPAKCASIVIDERRDGLEKESSREAFFSMRKRSVRSRNDFSTCLSSGNSSSNIIFETQSSWGKACNHCGASRSSHVHLQVSKGGKNVLYGLIVRNIIRVDLNDERK